jgi:hypothetical protein
MDALSERAPSSGELIGYANPNGSHIGDYVRWAAPADAEGVCVMLDLDKKWRTAWWRFGHFPVAFGEAFASHGDALLARDAVRAKVGLAA